MGKRPIVLGIAGGAGSGKTTVAEAIVRRIGPEHIAYVQHDSYYKDQSHLPMEGGFNTVALDLIVARINALLREGQEG